jgi:hypothetical protein
MASVSEACLSLDALVAFIAGRFSDDDAHVAEAHLAECRHCRELVSAACLADSAMGLERASSRATSLHVDSCTSYQRLVIGLSSGLQLLSAVAEAHTTQLLRPARYGEPFARGTVVGRFVVLDLLGRGGMGIVYRAYDPELDRKVALKLLRPGMRDIGDTRAHLLAEAQMMARISHANVIAIYDVGSYRDQVFAAMELVEGTTLRGWLTERQRAWREVVDVFLLAGEGLAAAHAARVVHRDFKPENVLLGRDGRVKVSDFGLATDPAPTGGSVAGTLGYLAVEAVRSGRVDERGDQFSFCVAFYEALHGRRPFSAHALDDLVAEVRRGPALDDGNRRVPARLNQVIVRGLALIPEDRYPAMRELLADVRRAVAVHWRRRITAAVAGVMMLLIAATAIAMNGRAETQPPCANAAAHLAGVWDPARRDAVRTAFVRTAMPAAEALFERAAAALDRYATEWVATRTEACEATEVRHEQPPALFELRIACLDRARIQLRALGDALVAADADTVRDSVTAGVSLPALDACSDADALRANVSPPLDSTARAQVAAVDAPQPGAQDHLIDLDGGPLGYRPDFRLPFGCGEAWQLDAGRNDGTGAQADFSLPGDGSPAELAVFAAAPGWVARVALDRGQVDIGHGGGWFTTYQHMTDISVSLHQYVGRGQVIGRVGNIGAKSSLGGPGSVHLHYEQAHQPGTPSMDLDHERDADRLLYLEHETFRPGTGAQIRTSTNNCPAGGAPGRALQYDIPVSTRVFSSSRATVEIIARRAHDHALLERWYDRGWKSAAMPHTLAGQPAVAVFQGELHVIARKSNDTLFDFHYSPFTGWKTTYLDGKVAGDPDVVVYGWNRNLHVAARGTDGFLYQWWTGANGSWSRAIRVGKVRVTGKPALFSHYDAFYIAARGADGSLWNWEADRRGLWTEWRLRGAVSGNPDLGVDPQSGLVNIVARGSDDRLYRWQSKDLDREASHTDAGWRDPEVLDAGRLVTGAPATIIYHGAMHVFARGLDNVIHHWWEDGTWHWEATGGAYTGDPSVFMFGDQLQTVGRSSGGNLYLIWYDPVTGLWNLENQDAAITD